MRVKDAEEKNVRVYRPNQRHKTSFAQTLAIMAKNAADSKELIWQLFKRDFFANHKKAFLGIIWVVLMPIFGVASWIFFKMTGMLAPGEVGIPYPAYVLIGTSMWGLFLGFFTSSSQTLSSVSNIIMQVHFPREALLLKQTAVQLANFLAVILLNLIVLIAFGVIPSPWAIFFPLIILPLFFLGAGLGLIVSLVSVVAIDIERVITAVMGLLLFTVPIVYSDSVNAPLLQLVITYNPLTYLVCSARDIIIYGTLYNPTIFFLCSAISFFFFLVACRLFYLTEEKVIEKMI